MQVRNETQPTITLKEATGRVVGQAEVVVEDERGSHTWHPIPSGAPGQGQAGGWRVWVEVAPAEGGFVQVALQVAPRVDRVLQRVFLRLRGRRGLVPGLSTARTRMLLLPDDVFTEKGVVTLGRSRGTVVSRFLTVLRSDAGGPSLLAGVGELADDYSFFRVDGETLEAGFEPKRALRREERYGLLFGVGEDPLDLLERYGRLLRRFGRTQHPSVAGWDSWDYYGASVTMDDLRAEMAAINASRLKGKLTHFVVDMGWWTDWGDLQPNRRFPATPRAIAREIAEAGFAPGIWHAPLQCSPWSYLGRHRQDLFARDEAGGPATAGGQAILDWSQPEVLQLLHDWFRGLRKAGFRYFKLDYIYHDAVQRLARRADDSRGLLGVIRTGLRTIREAVGEDSYILNCGAARESSVGITDASRICTDIHTFWSHIWHNAREIACHLWENRNLWNIDPDFALIRSAETSDDRFPNYIYQRRPWEQRHRFWMAGPEATFSELRVWLTVVHMAGGDVFLSDSIARLNGTGMEALAKLFPRQMESARPVDLFMNTTPRFWLGQSEREPRLAVFNWDDTPSPIVVPDGMDLPSRGRDVWTGEQVRIGESTMMPPRSAYLLEV